jgi:hypothetical protein
VQPPSVVRHSGTCHSPSESCTPGCEPVMLPLLGLAPASSSDRNLHPTLSDVSMRLGHAIPTSLVAEMFRAWSPPGASYKGAARFSLEPNRKLEVIRAEPSEGPMEATPGRMMQRKLGLPARSPDWGRPRPAEQDQAAHRIAYPRMSL